MDTQAIAASERFDDALKRLNATLTGWRNRLAAPLIEKFTALLVRLTEAVAKQGGFFHRLSQGVGLFLDGLNWFLGNETAIRVAIWAVVTALGAWALSAIAAAGASGTLGLASVGAALASAAAWLSAVAPFVLMAAVIALLIDDLYAFATGGKSALGEIIKWLDSDQLDDTSFERLLKRIGSLIFDVTDPKKWERLGESIEENVVALLTRAMGLVKSLVEWLSQGFFGKLLKPFADTLKNLDTNYTGPAPRLSDLFPSVFSAPGDGGAAVAPPSVRTSSSRNSNTFAPQINITTQPGADAVSIANTVRETVQETWDRNMREAAAQSGGFTK
jgi:hypothetical protein